MKKIILTLLVGLIASTGMMTAQTVTLTTPYFSTSYSDNRDVDYYCTGYHYDLHHHRHHNPHKCKACKKARKAWEKAHKHNKGHHYGHNGHRPAPRSHKHHK